jgi:long-chain acyl-CoA synthetase
VPPALDFEPLTLPQFLERAAAEHGDALALVFFNRRLTYRQLKDHVDRFAAALAGLGVTRDTRVAIQLPNIPQTVIAYYATLSLGAQVVMTNPLYTPRELEHQWADAGCRVAVVMDVLYANRIRAVRDRLPIEHYVVTSIPDYMRFPLNMLAQWKLGRADPPRVTRVVPERGVHSFISLVRETRPEPARTPPGQDDLAVLQYTGGTTGVTKGAMLTHGNLSANLQQARAWFTGLEAGREVFLTAIPLFHSFGMTAAMNFPVSVAGAMVLIPDPRDIKALVESIARHRVTLLPAVPAIFNAILNYPKRARFDLTSVRRCFSGSASLPEAVLRRFEELTGARIVEGFGLSEASPVTHMNPLQGLRKPGTIGIPIPDTDSRTVDVDDGVTETPPGEPGELVIRGPQIMRGYWNMPEETARVLRDGWLYTGDLAVIDGDGFHRIVGRKKEMIVVSGYKVFPDEVDGVLMGHPAVLEAATIGLPDPKRGERVKSFVVLKPGGEATAQDLLAFCRENLAAYKVPRAIEFRSELPRSGALKVLRRKLVEEELAKTTAGAGGEDTAAEPRQAPRASLRRARIPTWLKVGYTAFVAVLVPYYWRTYGPVNFLWFCDIALLVTVVALWLESPFLFGMEAVAITLPQLLWVVDFTAGLAGVHLLGVAAYMFDPKIHLFVRGLSSFHGWLPLLLVWAVWRLGYDRRALPAQTLFALVLLPVCYFLTPRPPAPATNPNAAVNLNWVFGPGENTVQTWLAPGWYLALQLAFWPLVIYVPTHWALSRLFKKPGTPEREAASLVAGSASA